MSVVDPPTPTLVAVNPGDRIEWGAPGHERTGTVVASSGLRHVVNPDDGPQTSIDNCAYGLKVLRRGGGDPGTPAELATPLTEKEQDQLRRCEAVVQEHIKSFHAVGNALLTIRDGRLYRETHSSFEAYLKERWNISRPRGYELMNAAETYGALVAGGAEVLPESERQTRPLNPLPDEQKIDAWSRAQEIAGPGKLPTSEQVAQAVDEIRFDYHGWEREDEIWWIDSAGNVRHGVVKQLWQGRLVTRPTDGGQENQLIAVDPPAARERDAKAPAATPFGMCDFGDDTPAVNPASTRWPQERLCAKHLEEREARSRVDAMATTAGIPELAGDLKTAAGLAPVEGVPETSLGADDQAAAAAPVPPAAEITEQNAQARTEAAGVEPAKPRALMGAEEIVNEQRGGGVTVPSTIGAAVLEGPIQMCMVLEDCVAWIASDAMNVKTFLCRLKAAAYQNGLSAAEILNRLEILDA